MFEQLVNEVDALPDLVIHELTKRVEKTMNTSGMFFRLFSRRKTGESVSKKIQIKKYDEHRKLQDLFGIRIALYFKDDITICRNLIEKSLEVDNVSEDVEDIENFKPTRLNYVCKIPEDIQNQIDSKFWRDYPIDNTFEIQIRTVFSEGWHEIEHDLRYKCKEDWKNESEMDRALNGIFATLETCDWSIITMFDTLSYKMYQNENWKAMLRNKLRIRFTSNEINDKIIEILNSNKNLAKEFLKVDREQLIFKLTNSNLSSIPKTYDNIIYVANELFIKDNDIISLTPSVIISLCSTIEI